MDHPAPRPPFARRSVVVCHDKFRGSMGARRAATVMAEPFRRAGADVAELPLSDGGEGFLEILSALARTSGPVRDVVTRVEGPTGRPVGVPWALTDDGTAIVE